MLKISSGMIGGPFARTGRTPFAKAKGRDVRSGSFASVLACLSMSG